MGEKKLKIKVELRSYLASINVTPYMLGKWVEEISPQTIYAVANGTRRPSLEVLEAILSSLHSNGYETTLNDIIQVETES